MKKGTRRFMKIVSNVYGAVLHVRNANAVLWHLANRKYKAGIRGKMYEFRHGNIRYVVKGKGEPLLLVHDLYIGNGMHEWARTVDLLAQHYTVYAVDLLGFGGSEKPALSYSAYLYVSMINDFVRDVIGEEVYACSSGKSAAILAAAAKLEPMNYTKLVLVSPEGCGASKRTPGKYEQRMRRFIELPEFGELAFNMMASKAEITKFLSENVYNGSVSSAIVDRFRYCSHSGRFARGASTAATLGFASVDMDALIKTIDIPVLIAWGANNKVNPIDNFKDTYTSVFSNDNLRVSLYQNSKMAPHITEVKKFYNEVTEFFGV